MGNDSDASESALTVVLDPFADDDSLSLDSESVRVASWEETNLESEELGLPPLKPSDIPDAPLSVRPMRKTGGHADRGEIGRGGMGAIRYVVDNRLLRPMALKTLPHGVTTSSESARRFVEEAQITGQLDHPNIVPVHTLGKSDDGSLFFTMKLVRGQTLSSLLGELGEERLEASNIERMVRILLKICDALSFAHSRGVVHRDLKPTNVMIGSHGQVYVVDWGLALLCEGPRLVSDVGKIIGTPGYMSPEQAWGAPDVDARADVYAIGGLLYRMLTAKRPHGGKTRLAALERTRDGVIQDPHEAAEGLLLPPELCRIAMCALRHEREARYQTVAELQAELEQFLRGGGWLETRHYEDGAVIVTEGDEASEAYIIISGACEAYKVVAGERVPLRTMGPGEIFGETAILTGKPRTANVAARGDVHVKVVTTAALDRELERNSFVGPLVRVLAERFRELDAKVNG